MIKNLTKKIEHIGCMLDRCEYFDRYYKKEVHEEVMQAGISSGDNVLCIGTGPMPCTAVNIALMTGCSVTAIDNDPAAVSGAQKLIEKRNFGKIVSAQYGNGMDYDVSPFNVIHVALQVEPRQKVIEKIYQRAKPGTKIIVRRPKGILGLYYRKTLIPGIIERAEFKIHKEAVIIEVKGKNEKNSRENKIHFSRINAGRKLLSPHRI